MESAIKDNAGEFELSMRIPTWVVKLRSLDYFKKTFSAAFQSTDGFGNALQNIEILQDTIIAYITNNPPDDRIAKAIINITSTVVLAPFSNTAMVESRVLCNETDKLISRAINGNTRILAAADSFLMPDTPYSGAVKELMKFMKTLPAPANTIANAFLNGQIGVVGSLLASTIKASVGMVTALFSACKDPVAGAPIDAQTDRVNDPKFERVKK
jgi:hypothetical protein